MSLERKKYKIIKYQYILILIFSSIFGLAGNLNAATRIWNEDCEDTTDSFFLMNNYSPTNNTDDSGTPYWQYFENAISQNLAYHHAGSRSMRWNFDATHGEDPHATLGLGTSGTGIIHSGFNTAFTLSSYNNQYWLFRWYEKSDAVIWGTHSHEILKHIYINYGGEYDSQFYIMVQQGWATGDTHNDFVGTEVKYCGPACDGTDTHYIPNDSAQYDNGYGSSLYSVSSGADLLNNGNWHKWELYLKSSTGSNSDGEVILKIDGYTMSHHQNISMRGINSTADTNPIKYIQTWPGNTATSPAGSLYLDDLEIFTLSSLSDVPADPYSGGGGDTTPPATPSGLGVS
jgi:hypothetical protein